MKHILPLVAALAALPLAACQNEPEVVNALPPDPLADQLANAAPVELPPAMKGSVSFRCQPGNSLVFVDFFQGDKMANLRTEKGGTPTVLKADEAGQPLTAEGGYSLTGDMENIKVTIPGKGDLTCHV
ncbi:hypothetical protein COC42_06210 [Sphingomonas spermidinifaciens]|uniref:C-type lysozyme inhibitor domain-containing protein n=1 Tax=Sphingomonas spermidinifaciens TaxID=1141889 RepID=A0A2A4B813_9SPHN|nr:hypothetical protein [Sphingomonas spermidinifaciens]PCD03919.1 hypothetical protein COC42_06210 [Sphingomonas spermidinifaciens]